jgi:hypothetical protein
MRLSFHHPPARLTGIVRRSRSSRISLSRVLALSAIVVSAIATTLVTSSPAHAWQGRMSRVTITHANWFVRAFRPSVSGWTWENECSGESPLNVAGADELNPRLNFGFGAESLVGFVSPPSCGTRATTTVYAELHQSWYRDAQGFDYIDLGLIVTVKSFRPLAATAQFTTTSSNHVLAQPGWTGWVSARAQNGSGAEAIVRVDWKHDWVDGDRTTCIELVC